MAHCWVGKTCKRQGYKDGTSRMTRARERGDGGRKGTEGSLEMREITIQLPKNNKLSLVD